MTFHHRPLSALAAAVFLGAFVPSMIASAEPSAGVASPVLYFDRAAVDAAFARGDVLVGEGEGRNYMVHASRREKAGIAEVHALDADVIHVLEGTATFVTGGIVVDAHEVAPDEIRGSSITGGETRRLAGGDVIVVPAGTPHWFREVPGVLTYYVVKVRR